MTNDEGSPQEQAPDLAPLVSWLAKLVIDYHDLRHEAIALPSDECKEFLTMQFPIVQGFSLQQKLRQLGTRETSPEALRLALQHLLPTRPETPT